MTNLLVLMYHRARQERHGNSPELLDAHFGHIARSFRNVLPGEELACDKLNVCLTFDDGYFDFYARVFPLLKKHGLRAVLAVPPSVITFDTAAATAARLNVDSNAAFADVSRGGFCNWSEIEELAASGHVEVAAHGYSHCALDGIDELQMEIDLPQSILSSRLGRSINSFVFPFGRYSRRVLRHARRRYQHVFRIGGAINRNWNGRVTYRVEADQMSDPAAIFSESRLRRYRASYWWNRLRLR